MSKLRRDSVETPDLSILGPIRQIIRMVEEGNRTKDQLQAFVEGRNPFENRRTLSITDAMAILGSKKVITAVQAHQTFRITLSLPHNPVWTRYTEQTLRECAVLNKSGQSDWRLVYGLPLSLREQRKIIGTDTNIKPCFYSNDWWMDEKEDTWAKSTPTAGYYLIDFKGRFNNNTWLGQENQIAQLGDAFERTDERVFTQALIALNKILDPRLYAETNHWGRIEDSVGHRITVGNVYPGCFGFFSEPVLNYTDRMFVCVSRKFDF